LLDQARRLEPNEEGDAGMTVNSSTDPSAVGPLSKIVLDYGRIMKRIIDHDSKQPGFNVHGWAELEAMVNAREFERVGNFLEVVNWDEYAEMLANWAISSQWECSFKRITEVGRLVFQELEERSKVGDQRSTVNSVSVYEFDENDKITHLDIYLQMKPAEIEMARAGGWAEASA
jgi:hypothetical protein